MLDVGRHGVIDFDHIRFVVRDRAVTGVVREDELVGRCAYPRVRDIGLGQGWRSIGGGLQASGENVPNPEPAQWLISMVDKEMGVRRRYYSDNGEDALVMWTDALDSDSFQLAMDQNERKLAERLGSAEVRLGGSIWSLPNG